ncbi:sidestep III [Carabus blaptoides fortunei]
MAVCFCQQILEGGNETVVTSSVTFAPVPEDDNTMLKCQGDNPSLPGTGLEDSFLLNIVYPPQVVLHLGSTLNPDDIKEGDDVYFECNIRANPKQHKITWFHNTSKTGKTEGFPSLLTVLWQAQKQAQCAVFTVGALVTQNMSSGIIISTHSLVLQKVTRYQGGAYTCLAVNPRGETLSQPVQLRVRLQQTSSGASVYGRKDCTTMPKKLFPEVEASTGYSSRLCKSLLGEVV